LEKQNKNVRYDSVPEYLLCRITDDLMEEPVILTSGFTYEKSAILSHFKINGAFDPLTREPVRADNLILNRNIK
jgi:STIP1 family protein 1